MLFNSIEFILFFIVFYLLYWGIRKYTFTQNLIILVGSYIFYGWWDWRFLSLIFLSTVVDYLIGRKLQIEKRQKRRKKLLLLSIFINIGFLGFFKYFNFFIDSFEELMSLLGVTTNALTLEIILPVGISFYTFQTLSYTIEVFRGKIEASKKIVTFAAYVAFFPQLVAGPIERASNLLPQFNKPRFFKKEQTLEGISLVILGLFKKMVIADNCAIIANEVFQNIESYSGLSLFLGVMMFSLQIYGDFSGYSDIARGLSKLLGFEIMENFRFPYFSRNIGEFWRRWHISLSTWFRDYLYIPMGGSRVNAIINIRNIFSVFLVSGLWHGANWTFVVWGGFHAILFLPSFLNGSNRKYLLQDQFQNQLTSNVIEIFRILRTFLLVSFGWIFFRAENLNDAYLYIVRMFSLSGLDFNLVSPLLALLVVVFFILEFVKMTQRQSSFNPYLNVVLLLCILYLRATVSNDFIYFQF